METLSIVIITFIAITFAQLTWGLIVEFFKVFKILTKDSKDKEMATYVTLDEFYNEDRKAIKQVVYKVDGDFNGDIKGDNVTVILMGGGNLNGNIESNDGNVVLIKGNVNGDIKANKVLMPNKKRDIYTGRRGIVVRCPMCNELYTQSLSINGSTSEDGTNLMLDVKIDVEETSRCKCESCRYYVNGGINHYWCTQGGMIRRCIKNGAVICKYYEGKNDH